MKDTHGCLTSLLNLFCSPLTDINKYCLTKSLVCLSICDRANPGEDKHISKCRCRRVRGECKSKEEADGICVELFHGKRRWNCHLSPFGVSGSIFHHSSEIFLHTFCFTLVSKTVACLNALHCTVAYKAASLQCVPRVPGASLNVLCSAVAWRHF